MFLILLYFLVFVPNYETVNTTSCPKDTMKRIKCKSKAKTTYYKGGVLIKSGWLLTTGGVGEKCVSSLTEKTCEIFLDDTTSVSCTDIIFYDQHSSQKPNIYYYDIALFSYDISENKTYLLASLPQNNEYTDSEACKRLVLLGRSRVMTPTEFHDNRLTEKDIGKDPYGMEIIENHTRCLEIERRSQDKCVGIRFMSDSGGHKHKVGEPILCVEYQGDSGICTGDEGSPVMCGNIVVGVISHLEQLCSLSKYTITITRLDSYYKFLKKYANMTIPFLSVPPGNLFQHTPDLYRASAIARVLPPSILILTSLFLFVKLFCQ